MNSYKQFYYANILKRCLLKTMIIFSFQYLLIMSLPFSSPALPWYPPMGLAFVWFYLVGIQAGFGIFLGGLMGYCLKGFSLESVFLYLSADLIFSWWGAHLCQNCFASDIRIFINLNEWLDFLKK